MGAVLRAERDGRCLCGRRITATPTWQTREEGVGYSWKFREHTCNGRRRATEIFERVGPPLGPRRTVRIDGPCAMVSCPFTEAHEHDLCRACGAVAHGNASCEECMQHARHHVVGNVVIGRFGRTG